MMNFIPKESIAHLNYPAMNVGLLWDIPNGSFVRSVRGNWVLVGGKNYIESISGPGNTFKTDLLLFPLLRVLGRLEVARGIAYDTEGSLKYERLTRIWRCLGLPMELLKFIGDDPLIQLIKSHDMPGEKFIEMLKDGRDSKISGAKKITYHVPWLDHHGEVMAVKAPHLIAVDSFSEFSSSKIENDFVEKHEIDSDKMNMIFMKDGIIKTRVISQLDSLTVHGDFFWSMTAHIGDLYTMNEYAPKPLTLGFTPNGKKIKGVPPKFQYINENLYEVLSCRPLLDDDKKPVWPKNVGDSEKSNDLFLVTYINSRNKNGPSGCLYPTIVSQAESIQEGLTWLNYIREVGKKQGPDNIAFGLQGNAQRYQCVLRPSVTIQRTTARKVLAEDKLTERAIGICSDLLQIRNIWRGWESWWLPPEEIYDRLTEQGYDIDKLLNTRPYWIYEECRQGKLPEMSVMDICLFAHGLAKPYFLEDDKKTYKKGMFTDEGLLTAAGFKKGL